MYIGVQVLILETYSVTYSLFCSCDDTKWKYFFSEHGVWPGLGTSLCLECSIQIYIYTRLLSNTLNTLHSKQLRLQ